MGASPEEPAQVEGCISGEMDNLISLTFTNMLFAQKRLFSLSHLQIEDHHEDVGVRRQRSSAGIANVAHLSIFFSSHQYELQLETYLCKQFTLTGFTTKLSCIQIIIAPLEI